MLRTVIAIAATLVAGSALAQTAPPQTAPATPSAADKAFFQPVTKIDGQAVQVVFGERAVFHLENGLPVLDSSAKGKLAAAHPAGAVKESFEAPAAGEIAAALDGSAEKKASYLKIWNGMSYPILYKAGVLVLTGSKLVPASVKVCAVPPGGAHIETWPKPVVAVALASFTEASSATACN